MALRFQFNCYIQRPEDRINKLQYRRGRYDKIRAGILERTNWEIELKNKDVRDAWDSFAESTNKLIKDNIMVSTTVPSKRLPVIDREALSAVREKRKKWLKNVCYS